MHKKQNPTVFLQTGLQDVLFNVTRCEKSYEKTSDKIIVPKQEITC